MIAELTYLGKNIWFSGSSTSLVTLGVVVFALSIGSAVYSLFLVRSRMTPSLSDLPHLPESKKNLVYALFAIPISLFSLAVAVIFSDSPSIVSAVWILESTVFAYIYGKVRNIRILV
jgi:hypothetical protein